MTKPQKTPISEARQIAEFMGLPSSKDIDDLELVMWVTKGFPVKTADVVVSRIDPGGSLVKVTDIIPKTTLHRRRSGSAAKKAAPQRSRSGSLTQDESEKLLALSRVFSEALRVYRGDRARAARFLAQKHPLLGDRSPIDLAKESIAGSDLVLKLITQADAGVAA